MTALSICGCSLCNWLWPFLPLWLLLPLSLFIICICISVDFLSWLCKDASRCLHSQLIVPPVYLSNHNKQRWGEHPSVPGSSSYLGAAAVEGNMCGVCGEAGEDAVRLAVGKRVDLHRVAGAGRHQPLILRRRNQEEFRFCRWQVWSLVACRWGPTLRAREWTFSPTVMNLGSSSSRPSHIRTSPSLPLVIMYLRSSQSNHRTALLQSLVVSKRVIFNTISPS